MRDVVLNGGRWLRVSHVRLRDAEGQRGAGEGARHLQRGSHWVIAPVCLLLALSMGTMCAQICPQSTGDGIQGNGRLRILLTAHRELVGRSVPHTGLRAPTHSQTLGVHKNRRN